MPELVRSSQPSAQQIVASQAMRILRTKTYCVGPIDLPGLALRRGNHLLHPLQHPLWPHQTAKPLNRSVIGLADAELDPGALYVIRYKTSHK